MKKSDARKYGQKARSDISPDIKKTYDRQILNNLLSLEKFSGEDYFVYLDFKSEVSTGELIQYLLKQGKRVFVPKIVAGDMYAVKYASPFIKNSYGIDEPVLSVRAEKIDVCITPLSAVDKNFNRVGYGKGYYDKFFEKNDCVKIGICYSAQVVDEIENEKTDVKLDFLITEKFKLERK